MIYKYKNIFLFSLWGLICLYFTVNHVIWRDEMRALSIVMDSQSIFDLAFNKLENEGHPLLWYIILYILYFFLKSTIVLKIASFFIGIFNTYLIVFKTKLSFLVKFLLIFTSLMFFEYTIKARNYGISITFILLIYILLDKNFNKKNYIYLTICTLLLAQTNVIGFLISIALHLIYLIEKRIKDKRVILTSTIAILFSTVLFYFTTQINSNSVFFIDKQELIKKVFSLNSFSLLLPYYSFKPFIDVVTPMGITIGIIILGLMLFSLKKSKLYLLVIYFLLIFTQFISINVYGLFARHIGLIIILYILLYFRAHRAENQLSVKKFINLPTLFLIIFFVANLVQFNENIKQPLSCSKEFSNFIQNEKFKNSILIGERDFFAESIPYYSNIDIYIPREKIYSKITHFTYNNSDTLKMSEIFHFSDSVKRPILLLFDSFSHYKSKPIRNFYNMRDKCFIFDSLNLSRIEYLKSFTNAQSDETYELYYIKSTQ